MNNMNEEQHFVDSWNFMEMTTKERDNNEKAEKEGKQVNENS